MIRNTILLIRIKSRNHYINKNKLGGAGMNPQNKKYDTLEELREAQREASKRYYERNREKVKARMKRNYEAKKKAKEGDING